MSYKFVELEISEHIATVSLARVDALNALSLEFAAEIARVFLELGKNDDVRSIILSSKARIFCAGLDLKDAAGGDHSSAKGALDTVKKKKKKTCSIRNCFT